jgi:hypothetical protein
MTDDDLIRRGDALAEIDLYRIDWCDAYDAIAALSAVTDTATWNAAIRAAADWIESAPNGTRFQDRGTILALLKPEAKP